jgi:hypothetical protein
VHVDYADTSRRSFCNYHLGVGLKVRQRREARVQDYMSIAPDLIASTRVTCSGM